MSSVATLIEKVSSAATTEERQQVAKDLAAAVKAAGLKSLESGDVLASLKTASEHKKNNGAREAAVLALGELVTAFGREGEPTLIPSLPIVFGAFGDKIAPVRAAAQAALDAFLAVTDAFVFKLYLPALIDSLTNEKKWQTKVAALQCFEKFSATAPTQVSRCLPDLLPSVSDCMWDTKPEVMAAAKSTLAAVTSVVGNPDIVPFLPAMISSIARPQEVPETVFKLAATTFVTTVEAPTLAIMSPLLSRGLAERKPAIVRQTCVIIDNMCKLVENPLDAEQFLPKLLPGIDRACDIAADPELRDVAGRARATLVRVGGGEEVAKAVLAVQDFASQYEAVEKEDTESVLAVLKKHLKISSEASLHLAAAIIVQLIYTKIVDVAEWTNHVLSYLTPFTSEESIKTALEAALEIGQTIASRRAVTVSAMVMEEGEELCNCEFSLAYGGMILLNNARLRLIRGRRYGLCGPNGAGKSTLMRAIANGQLDGFPSADELRTVYVEHALQAEDADLSVFDFIFIDPKLANADRDEVARTLESVGFTAERRAQAVGSLSGGWKMKLELARAMLMKADILLLDEPTNHLDVANVAWLENYLTNIPNVTSIIVSHDSGFLDRVCTAIIHYEQRKLKTYLGNLSEFVKQKPEAKSYYELSASLVSWKFPEPGFLDGVKSKDKAIYKMSNVNFTYPGTTKQILFNISLQCSLNSRVAVIGPNGAGKSTVIKILTGELVADQGDVVKHPNLRVAYVAQHAFHHIEQHLDKTPNEYIRWRYAFGEDRETAKKVTRVLTPEEEILYRKPINVTNADGVTEKRILEDIVGRRKSKRSFEYEIKWENKSWEENTWMSLEKLQQLGFDKLIVSFDDKEAARAGMYAKPLTQKEVEQHLKDLGLDPEFATHSRMRGLSGGQKVKVVLGAAMWPNPHILILDEPTNYLDRDSLGAMAEAIRTFGGGVVMISHNREFTGALCPEVWNVDNGRLTITGAKEIVGKGELIEQKEQEVSIDAFGNVSKVKSQKKLSRKEQKALQKKIQEKLKAGQALDTDEDEEAVRLGLY
ncbi:P-loop containing nucleoside triphosphate hydrolase protein [Polychytrium aggregatum]|uniref:P-loop containing nucleoside triphosphate hydrolase protein n=1 Tax=Polychytrium aggregatum TaxID=110093 RepID=UPI0022FEC9E7|nr:P-loop containing nucleoside triphosphate hydrolase protein [Polychytrium aggregatum]KAI9204768.1 P-loop containing nucleoside triphosphate hydrolase protein [Polychytrium aggregatum]